MNKKDILDFLKNQYKKQDESQVLLENQIDVEILSEAKGKNKTLLEE